MCRYSRTVASALVDELREINGNVSKSGFFFRFRARNIHVALDLHNKYILSKAKDSIPGAQADSERLLDEAQ